MSFPKLQRAGFEYNSLGKVTRATDPLGRTTVTNYYLNGVDVQEVRQVNGQSTDLLASYTYNSQHRKLTSTDAAGQTTTYTYNAQGQVATMTTPPRAGITENRTTTSSYDTNGYLQSVTGPATGATTTYTYDGYGRVRTLTDSEGYVLTTDYDALDRPTKLTYPDGTYEQTVYNRLDPEQKRDRLGRWTHTFFDALRRVVSLRDGLGRATTQQWCACGSLDKLIDGNGNATSWDRDAQGRVTKETRADASFTQFVYENTTSRLRQVTDAKNQIKTYDYFVDDTPKQVTYTNAVVATPTVSFTYDPVYKRLASMADGTGTTAYSYNPIVISPALGAGSLASVDGPLSNDTMTYTYDELGREVSRAINGVSVTRAYDVLSRVSGETNPLGGFTFGYVGTTSRLSSTTYPNGQTTAYSYFGNLGDHRLQQILNRLPGSVTLSEFDYTYDAVGNLSTWTQQAGSNPAKVYTIGYDAANELSTAIVTGPNPLPVPSRFAYAYDGTGNRTAEQLDDAVTAASYNNRNQLVSSQAGGALLFRGTLNETATVTVGGKPATVDAANKFQGTATVPSGTSNVVVTATDPSGNLRTNTYQVSESAAGKSYTFDADGNLTGDGTRTFEWDGESRLVAVNQGTHRSEFTYDGRGQRTRIIEKDGGAVTTDRRFVWCDKDPCEERDSSGSTVVRRFFEYGVQEGSTAYFYARDQLGSIRELTDASTALRARYDYDPWGRRTKVSGDKDPDLGFTGHFYHAPTGLSLTWFRAYDPGVGRWVSEDPLADQLRQAHARSPRDVSSGGDPKLRLDLYGYAQNRPTLWKDEFGLLGGGSGQNCTNQSPQCSVTYKPCDEYSGANARCFCQCAGNDPWSQQVRCCLFDYYGAGYDANTAHAICYLLATLHHRTFPTASIAQCYNTCRQAQVYGCGPCQYLW